MLPMSKATNAFIKGPLITDSIGRPDELELSELQQVGQEGAPLRELPQQGGQLAVQPATTASPQATT